MNNIDNFNNLGCNSTIRISKKELIDMINEVYKDFHGNSVIAVLTETECRKANGDIYKNQSVTFALPLVI